MNAHPAIHPIFVFAYLSIMLQTAPVIIVLGLTGRAPRLRLFILAFMLTTLVTIAMSAVMPAQGVWGQLHLTPSDYPAIEPVTQNRHLTVFHGLRDGTYRLLVLAGGEGVITFPSLHTALGLLFIIAIWPIKYLRWAMVPLNVAMILATPVDGGPYFSDVFAGLAIAIICWIVINRTFAATVEQKADQADTAVVAAPSIVPAFANEPSSQELDGLTPPVRAGVT